jgi:hypothetical protein
MMERTASESDNEALSAIRAANRLLAAEGLTWTRVLDRSVQILQEVEPAPDETAPRPKKPQHKFHGPDYDEVERAFEVAMENAKGGFANWLDDVYSQWQRKGWLSAEQQRILFDAADR